MAMSGSLGKTPLSFDIVRHGQVSAVYSFSLKLLDVRYLLSKVGGLLLQGHSAALLNLLDGPLNGFGDKEDRCEKYYERRDQQKREHQTSLHQRPDFLRRHAMM